MNFHFQSLYWWYKPFFCKETNLIRSFTGSSPLDSTSRKQSKKFRKNVHYHKCFRVWLEAWLLIKLSTQLLLSELQIFSWIWQFLFLNKILILTFFVNRSYFVGCEKLEFDNYFTNSVAHVVSNYNGIGKNKTRFCDNYDKVLRQGKIKMNQNPYALHPINEEKRDYNILLLIKTPSFT